MPLKRKSKVKIFKDKVISVKAPKGYVVGNVETDIVAFRSKGKAKVGILFTKLTKAPKYKRKKKTIRKKRRKK